MFKPPLKLYYSVPEYFPTQRVDVSELFGSCLQEKNVTTEWYMANYTKNKLYRAENFMGQKCIVPFRFLGSDKLSQLLTKLVYWATDTVLIVKAAFSSFNVLQTRDKYVASLAGLVAAKLTKKKFIYWCSYPFPEHLREKANICSGLIRFLLLLQSKVIHFVLYKIIMRLADHSFVQSQQMLENIAIYGVPKNRMTPVPMGVPSRLLEWTNSNLTHVVNNRIVYLGTLDSARHLDMLIDAFALVYRQCPTATLLMVGEGVKPQDRSNLQQQVIRLGLTDAVTFTGFVSIEQAWSYAASAAVCVSPIYPSFILNCGSPTKLHEYMALGRPVVCNHHPEQTHVIKESGAGLCVEWGAEPFATAILWMLKNPTEAELAGKKGPAWVANNRAYPAIADSVLRKYQELLQVEK